MPTSIVSASIEDLRVGDWVSAANGDFLFVGWQAPYPFQGFTGAVANIGNFKFIEEPADSEAILTRPVLGGMGW